MGFRDFVRRLLPSRTPVSEPNAARPCPPEDWSDEAGWDAYHEARGTDWNAFDHGLRYVPDLRAKGFQRIWFPGSGTSLAPRLYAELGFDVLSTDFASTAVTVQEQLVEATLPDDVLKSLFEHRDGQKASRLAVRRHDFRTPLEGEPRDVILNVRAFQGLSHDDLRATAKSHYDAVKPGGWTIFETVNVQGARRDEIEDALVEGGYQVPLRETNRWYGSALRATGVEFAMILGRPRAVGHRSPMDPACLKDQARLDALTEEYRSRAQREAEETRAKLEAPDVKLALVVYNTG